MNMLYSTVSSEQRNSFLRTALSSSVTLRAALDEFAFADDKASVLSKLP